MTKKHDHEARQIHQPLTGHVRELKVRLVRGLVVFVACFAVCFVYADALYQFLAAPLDDALSRADIKPGMIFTALPEVFLTHVKSAFFAALILSFPVWMNQLWLFIAPGLYQRERKAFLPFLWLTPFLFLGGVMFAYTVVLPLAWAFFIDFQSPVSDGTLPIRLEAKVNEYLSLTMTLLFAFGCAFLLPVLLALCARAGFIDAAWLRQKRRYAIIVAFIAAAVLTPPDIISQILLAIPLLVLYEISILIISPWRSRRG
ncbi:MAG: twin-arginine translocase subunit TatC [Alphaproteobacteria bacterium GM202ARS2]|nr:twin-arginine translocase subunit TatC [Alphaproteobacteria bacterium GM202ARS2]